MLAVLLLVQLTFGHLAHRKPLEEARARPAIRIVHMVYGIALLGLAWWQIHTGFVQYKSRPRALGIDIVYAV